MTDQYANSVTYLFDRTADQGRLEFVDRDRLDLLHRMSTNDMNSLQPGQGRSTVLTTALARIIDRLIVYNRGETVLALANYPDVVRGWLQKHVFFQDKVKIRDVSAEFAQLEIYGPEARAVASSFAPNAGELALHAFLSVDSAFGSQFIARTFPLAGDGFLLILPTGALETVKMSIMQQAQIVVGTDSDYETLRIAAALPGKGHELTEDYIPLEANLWDSVSFNKGCYIGQEIIARMESRNRLAKTLVPLHIAGPAVEGSIITDGERNIGILTSLVSQPDGSMIGLAFIKPDQAAPGTEIMIKPSIPQNVELGMDKSNQTLIPAEVAALLVNH